jgi:c-di-GMP-binding flagellar brake protein YcgR
MANTQKFKRAKMIGVIHVKKSPQEPPVEGYALDISYGGMAVNLDYAVQGKIEVIVQFPDEAGRKTQETVLAHVVWCKSYGPFYRTGIEFDNLNERDHPQLLTYIKGYTGPPAPHSPR